MMDIAEMAKNYEYVSFDLFDTLIFRTFLDYMDVYRYVEYSYNRTSRKPIRNFTCERLRAEKRARKRKGWKEINLDEIYKEFSRGVGETSILKNIEVQTEIENCIPNNENIELLNKLRKQGKKILITTDMYLPAECIEAILHRCEINYDNLFLSGAIGKTKADGGLFPYILHELAISSDMMIHIGDNALSDYERPIAYGIKAILYKRKELDLSYMIKHDSNLLLNHYHALAKNGLTSMRDLSREYKFGCSVMGPIIYEFCNWINKKVQDEGIDKILFLAREGYEIKKCYELLFPEDKDKCIYARLNKKLLTGALNDSDTKVDSQSSLLSEYLIDMRILGKKIGLVNNSYSGTGQLLLTRFMADKGYDIEIYGLQFASNKTCFHRLRNSYSSWIQNGLPDSLQAYLFERGSLIFEHLLFEPNGTSRTLFRNEEGCAEVQCEPPRLEENDFAKIAEFQSGMEKFIELARDNVNFNTGCDSIKYFVNVVQNPEFDDALMLGNLFDDDDYADRRIVDFEIPFNKSIIYRNNVYEEISWIQGYMKGKRVPGIYIKIFNFRLRLTHMLHKMKIIYRKD